MSLTVPTLMEGVRSRRGYVGLGSQVVACTRARAALQPCPHVRVNPAAHGAVEEDAHEVCMRYLASDIHVDILVAGMPAE